jgi:hypothetical protein
MKIIAFRDIAPCIRVEVDRRFRSACCLYRGAMKLAALMMEAVRTSETSLFSLDYKALYPRRLSSSFISMFMFYLLMEFHIGLLETIKREANYRFRSATVF